jgi:hypothetical protein
MKVNGASVLRSLIQPLVLLVALLVLSSAAAAVTVRGRLDRVYPNGARYPATGVAVTLYSQRSGRSNPAYAGPDGLYYIYNVPAGAYYLEVWTSRDPNVPPTVYPIYVREPYTDIPPIIAP